MTNKKAPANLTEAELQLLQQLRQHPELMERFQTILEITANVDGPLKSADKVEDLLIQEMRRLGSTSLETWAAEAEKRLGEQLQQKDDSAFAVKKKR